MWHDHAGALSWHWTGMWSTTTPCFTYTMASPAHTSPASPGLQRPKLWFTCSADSFVMVTVVFNTLMVRVSRLSEAPQGWSGHQPPCQKLHSGRFFEQPRNRVKHGRKWHVQWSGRALVAMCVRYYHKGHGMGLVISTADSATTLVSLDQIMEYMAKLGPKPSKAYLWHFLFCWETLQVRRV